MRTGQLAFAESTQKFHAAFSAWGNCLEQGQISTDSTLLERYGRDCGPKENIPLAVLFPHDTNQLQQIVRIASDYNVPLYPVSRGKNWGYGAACPVRERNVVVDLSRMARILEFNPELHYVVVEPGVTQEALYEFLQRHGTGLMMDTTGAPPDSSILGNLLERGYGQSAYSDRFLHSAGMEVVLANGEVVRTGFGHYDHTLCKHIFKWGIGPYLDGLFTQSNFGIVTKVGVWLMPKPEYGGVLRIQINTDQQLAEIVERMHALRLRGVVRSAIHFANDIRVISLFEQFPFQMFPNGERLPEAECARLRKKWNVSPWMGISGLYGTKADVRHSLREIRRALGGIVSVQFISEPMVDLMCRIPLVAKRLRAQRQLFELMKGRPGTAPLKGTYWRKRTAAPGTSYDPVRDRCGVMWCSPIIPMTASDLWHFLQITKAMFDRYSFEHNIAVLLVNDRACCCTVGIVFDQENGDESRRAKRCHHDLLEEYLKAGYVPYRYGIDIDGAPEALFSKDDPFWKLCRKLKQTLDPENILAPGRYSLG